MTRVGAGVVSPTRSVRRFVALTFFPSVTLRRVMSLFFVMFLRKPNKSLLSLLLSLLLLLLLLSSLCRIVLFLLARFRVYAYFFRLKNVKTKSSLVPPVLGWNNGGEKNLLISVSNALNLLNHTHRVSYDV